VDHLDGDEARSVWRQATRGAADRDHGVEERQREGGAHALDERTTGQGLTAEKMHYPTLLVRR
jgi:hypothetical protein